MIVNEIPIQFLEVTDDIVKAFQNENDERY